MKRFADKTSQKRKSVELKLRPEMFTTGVPRLLEKKKLGDQAVYLGHVDSRRDNGIMAHDYFYISQ